VANRWLLDAATGAVDGAQDGNKWLADAATNAADGAQDGARAADGGARADATDVAKDVANDTAKDAPSVTGTLTGTTTTTATATSTPTATTTATTTSTTTATSTPTQTSTGTQTATGQDASAADASPPSKLSVSPEELNFGNGGFVPCGATPTPAAALSLTLSNVGGQPFSWSATLDRSPSRFKIAPASGSLAADAIATITVTPSALPFPADTTANAYGDVLSITTTISADGVHAIKLNQTAQGAILAFQPPTPYDFGNVQVGASASSSIQVANLGNASINVTLNAVKLTGQADATFSVNANASGQLNGVAAGTNQSVTIAFTPGGLPADATTASGALTMSVASAAVLCAALPQALALTGMGTVASVTTNPSSQVSFTGPAMIQNGTIFGAPAQGFTYCGTTAGPRTIVFGNSGSAGYTIAAATLGLGITSPYTVAIGNNASAPYSLDISATQPGLWTPAAFHIGDLQYAAAVFPDFKTFVAPPGTIPGALSRQAHPGETIVLLGVGFGAVTPDIPAGRIVTEPNQLVSPVTFFFGQTPVTPVYAGLMPSGGAVGLYQFNLVVPAIPDDDAVPLTFTLGGAPGAQTLFTAVNANGRTGIGTAGSINVNGVDRTYTLYIPANYQPGTSGLVLLLHGMTGHAVGMDSWTQMNDKADQAGFALVCPQSTVNYAGVTQWDYFYYPYWAGPEPDDTGFLRQLIDTLQATVHPDPKRIYLTGHSAGAFMSHRAAVELSSRIAAIAPVSGTVFATPFTDQRVAPPAGGAVSVLIIHGDADTAVPYCGVSPDFRYASQDETFNYWAATNGCGTLNTTTPLCTNGVPSAVTEKRATDCFANTEVTIYKLIGGVHTWYTQPMNDPSQIPYNPDLNSTTGVTTNDLIWNFFAAHPKQ